MKQHTSFKIGGPADFFVILKNLEQLKKVKSFAIKNNIPFFIIGNGSNLLVRDKGIRGIVLKPNIQTIELNEKENLLYVEVGSGVPLPKLALEMSKKGYTGLEFAVGIPGTVGGAVRMNAGAYGGEMQKVIISTTYMDLDGNIKTIKNEEHKFEYRKSIFTKNKYIILSTTIQLKKGNINEIEEIISKDTQSRKEKQPYNMPSAGSTFKRKEGIITAKLIDEAGLKGYSIGDAIVSEKHAGFIINKGNATSQDIFNLIVHVKQEVFKKFKINKIIAKSKEVLELIKIFDDNCIYK